MATRDTSKPNMFSVGKILTAYSALNRRIELRWYCLHVAFKSRVKRYFDSSQSKINGNHIEEVII